MGKIPRLKQIARLRELHKKPKKQTRRVEIDYFVSVAINGTIFQNLIDFQCFISRFSIIFNHAVHLYEWSVSCECFSPWIVICLSCDGFKTFVTAFRKCLLTVSIITFWGLGLWLKMQRWVVKSRMLNAWKVLLRWIHQSRHKIFHRFIWMSLTCDSWAWNHSGNLIH